MVADESELEDYELLNRSSPYDMTAHIEVDEDEE